MASYTPIDAGNGPPNPLDTFTDREEILALFKQTLHSAQAGQLHLLAVKGNSGTGKTFLVSYLIDRVCPLFHWKSGRMSFAKSTPDFRTILLRLEDALKGCVPPASLEHYRAERNEYNRRFDEYKAAITIGTIQQHMEAREQASIANSPQNVEINAQLRERELHLRAELTRALLEFAEKSEQPLCLFIDGYERLIETDRELVGWLWEEVLLGLVKASPQPFLVTTCGWEWPSDAAIEPFLRRAELTDFDVEQMEEYLQKQGVITSPADPARAEREELISAFYDLTKGHPLVLGLAAIYLQHLDRSEQTARSLRANIVLLDNRARVEFLEQRLIDRLPEPYRALLERGPILRFLDQGALQALLDVEIEGMTNGRKTLDNTIYDRFLRYPFINEGRLEDGSQHLEPSFHELVRRVQLETLRRRPHDAKEQLHRQIADYYKRKVQAEREVTYVGSSPKKEVEQPLFRQMWGRIGHMLQTSSKKARVENASKGEEAAWLAEIPEQEFRVRVEYLYHSLQVRTLQAEAFDEWKALIDQAFRRWQPQQFESLYALIRQLVEEGEPFLSKIDEPYSDYLLSYAAFLEADVRWQEAETVLEEAVKLFEHMGNQAVFSRALNNLAAIYYAQGRYKQAEPLYQRALDIRERVPGPQHLDVAQTLNNLAHLYYTQGRYEQAEPLYQRALHIRESAQRALRTRERIPRREHGDLAETLNGLADLYRVQGRYEQAMPLLLQALRMCESVFGPEHPRVAQTLNNLAVLCYTVGGNEQAETLLLRALHIRERGLGLQHPDTIITLNNLAALYHTRGRYEQAAWLYQRGLHVSESVLGSEHPTTANYLNNLAVLYYEQGRYEQAAALYQRALRILERVLGLQHPQTMKVRASYTSLLKKIQRKVETTGPQGEGEQQK